MGKVLVVTVNNDFVSEKEGAAFFESFDYAKAFFLDSSIVLLSRG